MEIGFKRVKIPGHSLCMVECLAHLGHTIQRLCDHVQERKYPNIVWFEIRNAARAASERFFSYL